MRYIILYRNRTGEGPGEYRVWHEDRPIPEGWKKSCASDFAGPLPFREARKKALGLANTPSGVAHSSLLESEDREPLEGDEGAEKATDRFQVTRTDTITRDALVDWHREVTTRARQLMESKNADYAQQEDAFGNLRLCEDMGAAPISLGILIRMTDKVKRLVNLTRPGADGRVREESLLDNVEDLINYSVLLGAALGLHRE